MFSIANLLEIAALDDLFCKAFDFTEREQQRQDQRPQLRTKRHRKTQPRHSKVQE